MFYLAKNFIIFGKKIYQWKIQYTDQWNTFKIPRLTPASAASPRMKLNGIHLLNIASPSHSLITRNSSGEKR